MGLDIISLYKVANRNVFDPHVALSFIKDRDN